MRAIAKEWLERAKDDLDVIQDIFASEHLTNMVAFHAQQAVEKSFKAVLEEFEIGFIRTHSLETLYERVKDHIETEVNLEILKRLDEVYISSRYPGDLGLLPYGKPTQEDATLFSDFAQELFKHITTCLEQGEDAYAPDARGFHDQ